MECDFHAKWLQITVIPVKEPFAPLPAGDRTTVSTMLYLTLGMNFRLQRYQSVPKIKKQHFYNLAGYTKKFDNVSQLCPTTFYTCFAYSGSTKNLILFILA